MKNKMAYYLVLTFLGLAIVATGIVLLIIMPDAEGILKTLPFICIGVGSGVFGGNLSNLIKANVARKDPEGYKRIEIEEKDERNIAISNRAKAKAFNLTLIVFGVLVLTFALVGAPLYIVLTLVAAYLFISLVMAYYLSKYHKEM